MQEKLRAHLKSEVVNATPCQCKFPYKYGAKKFDHCNQYDDTTKEDSIAEPYCYTKVDSNGVKVDGATVNCETGCPTDSKYKEWAAAQTAKE